MPEHLTFYTTGSLLDQVSTRSGSDLAYIKEVWTDMRPLSLRKQMEQAAGQA